MWDLRIYQSGSLNDKENWEQAEIENFENEEKDFEKFLSVGENEVFVRIMKSFPREMVFKCPIVFVCVFLCECDCVCVSVCVSVWVWPWVCVSVCVSLSGMCRSLYVITYTMRSNKRKIN